MNDACLLINPCLNCSVYYRNLQLFSGEVEFCGMCEDRIIEPEYRTKTGAFMTEQARELEEQQRRELRKWLEACDHDYNSVVDGYCQCRKCGKGQRVLYGVTVLCVPSITFDTANDIHLLSCRMIERCCIIDFGDWMHDKHQFFASIENWLDLSPSEQAALIHSFLKEVGEIK